MGLEWWPSAGGESWRWAWQAQPAVWLLLVSIVAGYVYLVRRAGRMPDSRLRGVLFASGVAVLWLALDWPIGTLAAGYLLSAAELQYLLISLVAVPLALLGLPPAPQPATFEVPRRRLLLPLPLLGAVAFGAILFITQIPAVVNGLRGSQAGSAAIVLAWLLGAVALWWPLLRTRGRPLSYMGGAAYLFVPFILPKAPGLVFATSDEPIYEVYMAAAGAAGFSAAADQRLGGVLLWSAGTVMVFVALGVLFVNWSREERRVAAPGNLYVPADPRAVELLFGVPGAWAGLEAAIRALDAGLPPAQSGAELRFIVLEVASPRVVLQLHAPLAPAACAALAGRANLELARSVGRRRRPERERILALLSIEVIPFGSRVG